MGHHSKLPLKYLFYILVLVNLVFIGWKYGLDHWVSIPEPGARAVVPMDSLDGLGMAESGFDLLPTESDVDSASENALSAMDESGHPRSGCMMLGPFTSREDAEGQLPVLETLAKDVRVTNRSVDVPEGYWVLFTKAITREAALANRQLLLNRNFYETWLFDRGPMAGSIAFGLYPTEEEANAAQTGLRDRGINAKVKPRLVRGSSFWIRIPWSGSVLEFDEAIQTLKGHDVSLNLPSSSVCP